MSVYFYLEKFSQYLTSDQFKNNLCSYSLLLDKTPLILRDFVGKTPQWAEPRGSEGRGQVWRSQGVFRRNSGVSNLMNLKSH